MLNLICSTVEVVIVSIIAVVDNANWRCAVNRG